MGLPVFRPGRKSKVDHAERVEWGGGGGVVAGEDAEDAEDAESPIPTDEGAQREEVRRKPVDVATEI